MYNRSMDKLTIGLILGIIGGCCYQSSYERHLQQEARDHWRGGSYYRQLPDEQQEQLSPVVLPAGERKTTG